MRVLLRGFGWLVGLVGLFLLIAFGILWYFVPELPIWAKVLGGVGPALIALSIFLDWGNLQNLPAPLNTGEGLFRAALQHKIITVPGSFFDVDPGGRRVGRASRFKHHARFSFGPSERVIETAIERLGKLVAETRGH